MEYNYVITTHYDGNYHSSYRYSDAIEAVHSFDKCVDWGFANDYSVVNLEMPSGKMYTRIFYREGRRVVTA